MTCPNCGADIASAATCGILEVFWHRDHVDLCWQYGDLKGRGCRNLAEVNDIAEKLKGEQKRLNRQDNAGIPPRVS